MGVNGSPGDGAPWKRGQRSITLSNCISTLRPMTPWGGFWSRIWLQRRDRDLRVKAERIRQWLSFYVPGVRTAYDYGCWERRLRRRFLFHSGLYLLKHFKGIKQWLKGSNDSTCSDPCSERFMLMKNLSDCGANFNTALGYRKLTWFDIFLGKSHEVALLFAITYRVAGFCWKHFKFSRNF